MFLWLACTSAPEAPPPPLPSPPPSPPATPPPAWIVDLHVDTLTELADRSVHFDDPDLQSGIPAMKRGGVNLVFNVIWPPRDGEHEAYTLSQLQRFEQELQLVQSDMALARNPTEADAIIASGKIATGLALEGAHGIEVTGIDALRKLHEGGLSMLGLTWSLSNRFAGSSSDGDKGLTEDGRALIAEAESLGILIDVSHASKRTTLEACAVAKKPLIASHSNAQSLQPVPRNLSTEEIAAIARTGGLVGVMFHAPFVGRQKPNIPAVADQVDAIVQIAGIDHVGIGSDYDGDITPPSGLPDSSALPALWTELQRRGYDDEALRKLKGGNFKRIWEEVSL